MPATFVYNEDWSSIKWDGSAISNRFTLTTLDKEVILFERENNRILTCASITVEANAEDLYFTIIKGNVYLDGEGDVRKLDGTLYDYTDSPIFYVEANEKVQINGLDATGIRFTNGIGTSYFIQAMGYFSDDRFEGSALTYEQVREQATGTQMLINGGSLGYATLRERATHTSTLLKKIPNGEIINVADVVMGSYVNGTYFWVLTEYNGTIGFINYNSLIPYV